MTATGRERLRLLACVAAMAIASGVPLHAGARASRLLGDDAFITLTVARSLARGDGFGYRGDDVLATTSPMLAMLIGGACRVVPGADPADLAVWIGAIAWLATGWVVFGARRALGLGLWPASAIGVVVLCAGWTRYLGMEAHLFSLLLVGSVAFAAAGRPVTSGLTAGLCALTRGEGLLLLPLLVPAVRARACGDPGLGTPAARRLLRTAAAVAAGALVVLLPWALYAERAFGSPLPGTLSAKLAQASSGYWQPFAADLLWRWLPLWSGAWGRVEQAWAHPIWLLTAFGLVRGLRRDRWAAILAAWSLTYVLAYACLGVPSYPWYSLSVLFVLQVLAALGAARLAPDGSTRWAGAARRAASATAIAWLVLGAAFGRVESVRSDEGDPRARSYLGLASWLRQGAPSEASVAFMEVGYIGYFAPQPIVDLAGLVTPDVVPDVRRGDFAAGFYRHRPDLFVYLPEFDWALEAIRSDPRFAREYEPVATLPGPHDAPFTVYRRASPGGP